MFTTLIDLREGVKQKRKEKERKIRKYRHETVSILQDLNQFLFGVPDRLTVYDKGMTNCSRCTEGTLLNYVVVNRTMAPRRFHIIISRTCESYEYVILESKILPYKVADAIKIANQLNSRQGDCPGLPDGPRVITWVLKSEKRRGKGEGE